MVASLTLLPSSITPPLAAEGCSAAAGGVQDTSAGQGRGRASLMDSTDRDASSAANGAVLGEFDGSLGTTATTGSEGDADVETRWSIGSPHEADGRGHEAEEMLGGGAFVGGAIAIPVPEVDCLGHFQESLSDGAQAVYKPQQGAAMSPAPSLASNPSSCRDGIPQTASGKRCAPTSGHSLLPSTPSPSSFRHASPFMSFRELNLAKDARLWGPLPGYEAHELKLDHLAGGQQPIATGRLGTLYKAQLGEEEVALKIVQCIPPMPDADKVEKAEEELRLKAVKQELVREVEALSKVDHPRLVKLLGVAERQLGSCAAPSMWCIAMEFMGGGSLRTAISRSKGERWPLETVLCYAHDIASAMAHLHSLGIIHRDLKSPNVLLSALRDVAKVADFGTARKLEPQAEMTAETGTFRWMAPEMIHGKEYNEKVDVYSFGIILWELLTMQFPWEKLSCMQVAFAVAQKGDRPVFPTGAGLPPCLVELAKKCWDSNPVVRPSFELVAACLETAMEALPTDPSLEACTFSMALNSHAATGPKVWHKSLPTNLFSILRREREGEGDASPAPAPAPAPGDEEPKPGPLALGSSRRGKVFVNFKRQLQKAADIVQDFPKSRTAAPKELLQEHEEDTRKKALQPKKIATTRSLAT